MSGPRLRVTRAAVLATAGFLGFTIGAAAVEAAQPDPATGAADWLFSGGLVYTVDPTRPHAEAVAVRGDTIVYVGDLAGAEAWKDNDTREVDLSGRMLLPGFVDAHDHLSCLGATKLGVNVRGLKGKEAILERVRSWVERQPKDAVLRGHGWSMESFGGASPRRRPHTRGPQRRSALARPHDLRRRSLQRQIEATQGAGFDMHIHVDADGSTRTVLDALERARDRIGNRGIRHTICHNTMVPVVLTLMDGRPTHDARSR